MALPENVIGTLEQSITFRGVAPTDDNAVMVATRSKALRELHDDLIAMMPMPGTQPAEESLIEITIPTVGVSVDNVVRISHVELNLSDIMDDEGVAFVNSLRVVFTQAVLS